MHPHLQALKVVHQMLVLFHRLRLLAELHQVMHLAERLLRL